MGISGGGGGGGSASQGYQYQNQLSQALSGQSIWGPQAGALTNMYTGATNVANRQAATVPGAAARVGAATSPYGYQGLAALGKIAGGGGPLAQYTTPNNALARQQLSQQSAAIGQDFSRNILPTIRAGAGSLGGMGSSREALAKGVAAGDAARAISQAGTNLYAEQYGIGANAAAAQQQAMLGAGQALPEAAAGVYNLGMQPYQAQWAPYSALAAILGGPTALSSSIQQSQNIGEGWNAGVGNPRNNSFGFQLF